MSNRAEQVASAILYEGYILYPYRPSSVKNRQRWNFGVVYPPSSSEGAFHADTMPGGDHLRRRLAGCQGTIPSPAGENDS